MILLGGLKAVPSVGQKGHTKRSPLATHLQAQHSTAQHSTPQRSTAQHSTAQHSTAQHSTAQHSTAQHSTAQYDSVLLFCFTHSLTHSLTHPGFDCFQRLRRRSWHDIITRYYGAYEPRHHSSADTGRRTEADAGYPPCIEAY